MGEGGLIKDGYCYYDKDTSEMTGIVFMHYKDRACGGTRLRFDIEDGLVSKIILD